jgi:hypothetical protein
MNNSLGMTEINVFYIVYVFWAMGDFQDTSEEMVNARLAGYNNYKLYKGLFEETTKQTSNLKFCFAHIDADIFSSTIFATKFVYDRMVPGGIIINDDYGDLISEGANLATNKFFEDKPEKVIYLPTKQALIIKFS